MFTTTCNLCALSSEEDDGIETFVNEHKCTKDDVLKKITIDIIDCLCPHLSNAVSDCRCSICSCLDAREVFDDVKYTIRQSKLWEIVEKNNFNNQAD